MSNLPVTSSSTAPIYWMALGTFAIGTESFMIAPLLPKIAADLSVSVSTAGQLVTAFTLALALSSPVLTALTARMISLPGPLAQGLVLGRPRRR